MQYRIEELRELTTGQIWCSLEDDTIFETRQDALDAMWELIYSGYPKELTISAI